MSDKFNFSFIAEQIRNSFQELTWEMSRPSILMRPSLQRDGNQWCALYGENLQSGIAGFGNSPEKAMIDFDKNWKTDLSK